MKHALELVQDFFPNVSHVVDATKSISVEVTKRDSDSAAVRNHKACAMAVACKRKEAADGVIISIKTAYVIKGNKAWRYKLPESTSREVVSFDRNGGFAAGEYQLWAPHETEKLGARQETRQGGARATGRGDRIKQHHTTGIRTVLGSKLQ